MSRIYLSGSDAASGVRYADVLDQYPAPVRAAFEDVHDVSEALGAAKFHLRKGHRDEAVGELQRALRLTSTAIRRLGGTP